MCGVYKCCNLTNYLTSVVIASVAILPAILHACVVCTSVVILPTILHACVGCTSVARKVLMSEEEKAARGVLCMRKLNGEVVAESAKTRGVLEKART